MSIPTRPTGVSNAANAFPARYAMCSAAGRCYLTRAGTSTPSRWGHGRRLIIIPWLYALSSRRASQNRRSSTPH
ncbi:hypothetical protein GCM10020218_003930 [Dactylosporangium vinaceum]